MRLDSQETVHYEVKESFQTADVEVLEMLKLNESQAQAFVAELAAKCDQALENHRR